MPGAFASIKKKKFSLVCQFFFFQKTFPKLYYSTSFPRHDYIIFFYLKTPNDYIIFKIFNLWWIQWNVNVLMNGNLHLFFSVLLTTHWHCYLLTGGKEKKIGPTSIQFRLNTGIDFIRTYYLLYIYIRSTSTWE